MTYQAGISLGLSVRILAAREDDGAALVAHDRLIGAPNDFAALAELAAGCEVVTFDHELVDVEQLRRLEAAGRKLRPGAAVMAVAQDKRLQRERLGALGFPGPAFRAPVDGAGLIEFGAEQGWPIVAKARRGGYDGRGVWVLRDPAAAERLAAEAAAAGLELLVEAWVSIERELAILVASRPSGERVVYPLVETVQQEGICREVLAPAEVSPALAEQARVLALGIAEALGVVGVLAVELFEAGGRLLVNELATRPHNSGHYSIEGCLTSQFENHLRAVLDWPLGATDLVAPAVATVNVLGVSGQADFGSSLPAALAVPGARVHLYGKSPRPGRKLGHVTAIGRERGEALARARRAAGLLTQAGVGEARG